MPSRADEADPLGPVKVSVVMPCRNEMGEIREVIRSVLALDRPEGGIEFIIADGMSDDGTRACLGEVARAHPEVRVLDNPAKVTPHALNLAIRAARGAIIVRLDAHSRYDSDYLVRLVEWLERSGADNVGGILVAEPSKDTLVGRALACAVSHRFGAGNAHHKTARIREPRDVDTVPFGCFRRLLFEEVGYFREELARSQDMEFNLRLRTLGKRILLVPDVVTRYRVRGDLRRIVPYYFSNGFWVLFPLKFGVRAFALRHLVPCTFVVAIAALGLASMGAVWARWLLVVAASSYGALALAASVDIAVRERKPEYLATMPWSFLLLHVVHGAGSVYAGACLLLEKVLPAGFFVKSTPSARV